MDQLYHLLFFEMTLQPCSWAKYSIRHIISKHQTACFTPNTQQTLRHGILSEAVGSKVTLTGKPWHISGARRVINNNKYHHASRTLRPLAPTCASRDGCEWDEPSHGGGCPPLHSASDSCGGNLLIQVLHHLIYRFLEIRFALICPPAASACAAALTESVCSRADCV